MKAALKVVLAVVATAVVIGGAVFGWFKLAPRRVPPGQPPLATIHADSFPGFRAAFNANDGRVRLLVLLSPT